MSGKCPDIVRAIRQQKRDVPAIRKYDIKENRTPLFCIRGGIYGLQFHLHNIIKKGQEKGTT